jgi:hypothetical protein
MTLHKADFQTPKSSRQVGTGSEGDLKFILIFSNFQIFKLSMAGGNRSATTCWLPGN